MLILKPRNVNSKHKVSDKNIYEKAFKNFLLRSKSTLSNEKVEKVVKDPKIPIIKKYFIKSEDIFLLSIKFIKSPIINDPNIFTKSVPINKEFENKYVLKIK